MRVAQYVIQAQILLSAATKFKFQIRCGICLASEDELCSSKVCYILQFLFTQAVKSNTAESFTTNFVGNIA
jgi:hypothetical protein